MHSGKIQAEASANKTLIQQSLLSSEDNPKVLSCGFTVKLLSSQGARGECYLAQLTETGEKFLLKKNLPQLGQREIECLEALNPHDNIVQMLDFAPSTISGSDYSLAALELADSDLANLIGLWGEEQISITVQHINNIFSQLLSAYLHIREKGLLKHTDFSDKNTLYFSSSSRLKICDFNNDFLDKYEGDVHLLKSMSRFLFRVVHRIAHNCDAITGKYFSAPICKDNCSRMYRESPNSEVSDWKKILSEEQVKLIIGMFNRSLSSEKDIYELQKYFVKDLHVLPHPKKLV